VSRFLDLYQDIGLKIDKKIIYGRLSRRLEKEFWL